MWVFRAVRMVVRCLSLLFVLLLCAFVFLRTHGVPKPVLREIVKRANAAGIPVDVEHVVLTLRGWRASNVRYYSDHPDDLEPIFRAREVLLDHRSEFETPEGEGWVLDIQASGVNITPSVGWGVEIPEGSAYRSINDIRLSLAFRPGRVELRDGRMSWLGADFRVNGVVLKAAPAPAAPAAPAAPRKIETPTYVDAERFQLWEDRLKSFQLNGGALVDVDFTLDADAVVESRMDVRLEASEVAFRGVEFDKALVEVGYARPLVTIGRVQLGKDGDSLAFSGDYNPWTNQARGGFRNAIRSNELLLIAPQVVLDVLVKAELRFGELPRFQVDFGPAAPNDLLNSLTGSYSIRDLEYRRLVIDSLRGDLKRANDRLELTNLSGSVLGQEERAEEVGSCLKGGSAVGEVFWDWSTHEFGVKAEGSFDPNLLIRPLDLVSEATNAIARFQFLEEPPQIALELGSCYTNWTDFFINIHAMANEARVHDAELTSVNTSAYYQHAVLRLDPIAAMKDVDFMKGSASIEFKNHSVTFDVFGSMPPDVLEDAVYAGFDLFGSKIITTGDTRIQARGSLDWATMAGTKFSAEVEADQVEIPVAGMKTFSAVVTGAGPLISVEDAAFELYDGEGRGAFSIRLDPATNATPYEMTVEIKNAEFRSCLEQLNAAVSEGVRGTMSGEVHFRADMSRDFFETANGTGTVAVVDGQLADLPFFSGFTKVVRRIFPGFNAFSITSLKGDFELKNGAVHSRNAYFEGDVISAKGSGSYSKREGFDAKVQAQVMSENQISKVLRVITDPFFKLFETRLTGTLSNPNWRLENLPGSSRPSAPDE